jgi:hypothetical protein
MIKALIKTITEIRPLLVLVSLFIPNSLSAQSFYKERIARNNIITIGAGPSFAYLDNGGQYRELNFEIKPSFSLAFSKRVTPFLDLRTTAGVQAITNGGNPPEALQEIWSEKGAAFTAKGPAYFLDFMPSLNLIPFSNHMNRSRFNFYGGLGLGVMSVNTEQTKSFYTEEIPTKVRVTTGYVPVRAGLSYSLGPYSDLAGEGTMLLTFTDKLDGNIGSNRFGDHLAQAQIVYRRYFAPRSKE